MFSHCVKPAGSYARTTRRLTPARRGLSLCSPGILRGESSVPQTVIHGMQLVGYTTIQQYIPVPRTRSAREADLHVRSARTAFCVRSSCSVPRRRNAEDSNALPLSSDHASFRLELIQLPIVRESRCTYHLGRVRILSRLVSSLLGM